MEAIKEFEVELDIADRTKLYDYGKEEFIYRQEKGEWNFSELKSRAKDDHLDPADENKIVRVRNMDGAIANFRFLEKDSKADSKEKLADSKGDYVLLGTFNSMQESQVLPRRVLPVYYPGEIVHGRVILDLKDKLEAESFVISFKGKADVRIRVYHGRGFYDDYGKERYVNVENKVWEKSDSTSDVADSFTLLSTSVSRSKFLPPGRHEFDFDFRLPDDARQSTPSLLESYCDYGYIAYRVKATIEKSKSLGKGNIAVCRGIWVDKLCDVQAQSKDDLGKVIVEEHLDTGLFKKSGQAGIMVTLPRRVYARGEAIPVNLSVENACEATVMSISSQVVLAGKVRSSRAALRPSRSVCIKAKKHKVGPVNAKDFQNFSFNLPLDFSETILDSNLIPVGILEECDLIDVKYEIIIKAKRKGLHRNLEMKIPVTICTHNSKKESK